MEIHSVLGMDVGDCYGCYLGEFIFLSIMFIILISKFTHRILPRSFSGDNYFPYANSWVRKHVWDLGEAMYTSAGFLGWFLVDLLIFFFVFVLTPVLFFLVVVLLSYIREFPPDSVVVMLLAWFTAWIVVSIVHVVNYWRHKYASSPKIKYLGYFEHLVEVVLGTLISGAAGKHIISFMANPADIAKSIEASLTLSTVSNIMYYLSYVLIMVLLALEINIKVKTHVVKKIVMKL